MKSLWIMLSATTLWVGCNLAPAELNLGEAPRSNAQGELTLPMNVTKSFSPTGYFYNVWAPADTSYTVIDYEKWNNFLAYQSVYQHPACMDRVSLDTLAKYDSTLYTSPTGFYTEFNCSQFTYAPISADDIYGGVFWLRGNNFGNREGVKIAAGAKYVKFWARSPSGEQSVKFGVGVTNSSVLKPWYYFSQYVDTFGDPNPEKVLMKEKRRKADSQGVVFDSVVVAVDSLLGGLSVDRNIQLSSEWRLYTLDLSSMYNFFLHRRTETVGDSVVETITPYDSLPEHKLIGSFFWAIETKGIYDTSHTSAPVKIHRAPPLPDTVISAKYGSATILIDGIRYEK